MEISGQDLCPLGILPQRGTLKGWVQNESPECFTGSTLFRAIDGGAEVHLEYGFLSMARASYSLQKKSLHVEVYLMKTPEAAYGLMTTMREGPPFTLNDGSYSFINRYYGMLVKGRYFVVVIDQSGKEDLIDEIKTIFADISTRIIESADIPEIISSIKQEGILKAVMFSGDIVLGNYCFLGVSRPFQYEQGVYIEKGDGSVIIFQSNKDIISDETVVSTLEDFSKTGNYTVDFTNLLLTDKKGVTYSIKKEANRVIMASTKSQ